MYKPEANRWYLISSISREHPPPTAGHSASIIKDTMIVFGGSSVPGTGYVLLYLCAYIVSGNVAKILIFTLLVSISNILEMA